MVMLGNLVSSSEKNGSAYWYNHSPDFESGAEINNKVVLKLITNCYSCY